VNINPQRATHVRDLATRYVEQKQFCGISWRFAQHSDVLLEGEAGWLDEPDATPLLRDAVYRIYSMTKPLVSVLALQLIEEGAIRLSDPVALYLPTFDNPTVLQVDGSERPAAQRMTIEHLLTHRSGLSYDFLPRCDVARQYQAAQLTERGDRTLEQFVDIVASCPLAFEPGSQWRYSVSTDVLARVIEVATGYPLPRLLQNYLFKPCGMRDTAFHVPKPKQHRLTRLYGVRNLGQVPEMLELPQTLEALDSTNSHPVNAPESFVRGGHGLYSTTRDYQQFLPVLMTGKSPSGERLLSPAMVNFMWADRIPASQQPLYIGDNPLPGYGWNLMGRVMKDIGASQGLTLPNEGGWGGAAATYFFVHRESGLNGVVMTQYLGSAIPLGDDLRSAFLQAID